MSILSGDAARIGEQALDEECAKRHHLVIALSGAHAYGFPSPDSDLDLKAIHIAPTASLLGLHPPREAYDRLEVIEGVEIDYTSNELRGVLGGMLAGNGNYIERVWGQHLLRTGDELEGLQALWSLVISRRVHRHYRGFASSQRKAFEASEAPTAKKLLYVLRTALTGTHLLRSGELLVDLSTVCDEYGFGDARELIEAKKAGERTVLEPSQCKAWLERLDGLYELLNQSVEKSVLPEEPTGPEALEDWLIQVRRQHL